MRFFYLDPGLLNDLGHHAISCKLIGAALAQRGIRPRIFAYEGMDDRLKSQLGAVPYFRCWTYGRYDQDPVAGVLNNFEIVWTRTVEDLRRLGPMTAGDIVYLNSASAAQLMALVRWAEPLPPLRRPHVVLEFGFPLPSATQTADADLMRMLFKHAILHLTPELRERFHIATFDRTASEAYAAFLGLPVATLPLPREAASGRRHRGKAAPVTIAFLGHQRPDKGYGLLPEILPGLLAARRDIRVLVHNGAPAQMPEVQAKIRGIARDPRVILDEETADAGRWADLLSASDLIVCPYDPACFATGYSAVASEAIANAIPLVVPQGTSLAALAEAYGSGASLISAFEAGATLGAVLKAVDEFPELADKAFAASALWAERQGAGVFVDHVLALCRSDIRLAVRQNGLRAWSRVKPWLRTLKSQMLARRS